MVASAAVALWADRCPATFRFYTRAALQTRPRPGSALVAPRATTRSTMPGRLRNQSWPCWSVRRWQTRWTGWTWSAFCRMRGWVGWSPVRRGSPNLGRRTAHKVVVIQRQSGGEFGVPVAYSGAVLDSRREDRRAAPI